MIPQVFETEIIFFAAILLVAHLVGNNYTAGASSLILSHTIFLSEEKAGIKGIICKKPITISIMA